MHSAVRAVLWASKGGLSLAGCSGQTLLNGRAGEAASENAEGADGIECYYLAAAIQRTRIFRKFETHGCQCGLSMLLCAQHVGTQIQQVHAVPVLCDETAGLREECQQAQQALSQPSLHATASITAWSLDKAIFAISMMERSQVGAMGGRLNGSFTSTTRILETPNSPGDLQRSSVVSGQSGRLTQLLTSRCNKWKIEQWI